MRITKHGASTSESYEMDRALSAVVLETDADGTVMERRQTSKIFGGRKGSQDEQNTELRLY